MGRECGYLALMSAIAGGAEAVIIPEIETDPEVVAAELRAGYGRGKPHALVVVAEGARYNSDIAFTSVKRAVRTPWIVLDEMDLMLQKEKVWLLALVEDYREKNGGT